MQQPDPDYEKLVHRPVAGNDGAVRWTAAVLFTGLALFLTFNIHSRSGLFNYHSEIWADKAGYYVYLPAVLKYRFDPERFPDSVDVRTGNGFTLDLAGGRILNKYPSGLAWMQLPFFLAADGYAALTGYPRDGFSLPYHRMINVAAVFYLVLGMGLLWAYLSRRFSRVVTFLVLFSVFAATNLYHYALDETGMSHVYSFALFSAWLWLLGRTGFLRQGKWPVRLSAGLLAGLVVLVRPTNLIFLAGTWFFPCREESLRHRLTRSFRPRMIIPLTAGILIIWFPQLLYWKHTYGTWLAYVYRGEGFEWLNPALHLSWFAPRNGLFLYHPFYLFLFVLLIRTTLKKLPDGKFFLGIFLLISYVFSCWWDRGFGCSFGGRNYVEYLVLFSIPLASAFQRILRLHLVRQLPFWTLILLLAVYNIKLTYAFDECFFGEGYWDWNAFGSLLGRMF